MRNEKDKNGDRVGVCNGKTLLVDKEATVKTSCIKHPEKERLIIIRQWQLDICDGDKVQAALLSFFEYWHNIKLEIQEKNKRANEIAEMHGDIQGTQDETLVQFHTMEELKAGIMSIGKEEKIAKSLKIMQKKGFLSIMKNPNPRYKFDKTNYFIFHPDVINNWLDSRYPENKVPYPENKVPYPENKVPYPENKAAITETTTKTTTETTTEKKDPLLFSQDSYPIKMSELLFSYLVKRDPKIKKPNMQKWAKEFDRINRLDGREWEEIEFMIIWVHEKDDFWKKIIRSPSNLRKHYSRLLDVKNDKKNMSLAEKNIMAGLAWLDGEYQKEGVDGRSER